MNHQDWEPVIVRKRSTTNATRSSTKQRHNPLGAALFRELDSDNPTAPKKVNHATATSIQKARNAKGLTQKQLASRINVPASTINDYESGRAIPDRCLLNKIGRTLGIKL